MTTAVDRPVIEYRSVRTWRQGLSNQWGGDPLAEEPEKTEALVKFCEFVGEDPDSIVERCFRVRKADGERVISLKWRTHYADKVKEFRARDGSNEGPREAAAVLSFLIHNGILIQA
jgi:hypothetical protein